MDLSFFLLYSKSFHADTFVCECLLRLIQGGGLGRYEMLIENVPLSTDRQVNGKKSSGRKIEGLLLVSIHCVCQTLVDKHSVISSILCSPKALLL